MLLILWTCYFSILFLLKSILYFNKLPMSPPVITPIIPIEHMLLKLIYWYTSKNSIIERFCDEGKPDPSYDEEPNNCSKDPSVRHRLRVNIFFYLLFYVSWWGNVLSLTCRIAIRASSVLRLMMLRYRRNSPISLFIFLIWRNLRLKRSFSILGLNVSLSVSLRLFFFSLF